MILSIDACGGYASIGVLEGDVLRADRTMQGNTGIADNLATMLAGCLQDAAVCVDALDAVAVTVGPGSFTGIRASLALGLGFCTATGIPIHGVRLSDAFRAALPDLARPLWIAVTARRGRLFLEREGVAGGFAEDSLPVPDEPIALAGERAADAAALFAAGGHDILLTPVRHPHPTAIATALRNKIALGLPTAPASPLYVDPPEAKLPQGGLRPEPV